jgi:hypothetical protein
MNKITTTANFANIPAADNRPLMQVVAGLDTGYAISMADCLDLAVRELLTQSVARGGMGADIAHLCEFALDASGALRAASGTTA